MTDDEYADVRTLLRERTATPQHRVDVDEVIRRGRRSRRIRRTDQALAVGAVLAVVVAAGVLVSRPHESTSPVGPSPSASRTTTLPAPDSDAPKAVLDAVASAQREGTLSGPAEWIETTRAKSAGLVVGSVAEDATTPVYVIQMQGEFVLDNVPRPAGAKSPRGTVLLVILPVVESDKFGGEVSLTNSAADLGAYGTVHRVSP